MSKKLVSTIDIGINDKKGNNIGKRKIPRKIRHVIVVAVLKKE